jgi:hypothetical protein
MVHWWILVHCVLKLPRYSNVLDWKRIVRNQILLSLKARGKNIKPRNTKFIFLSKKKGNTSNFK